MYDFNIETHCDHKIREDILVTDDRYLVIPYALSNSYVKVFHKGTEIPSDDPKSGWHLESVVTEGGLQQYRIKFFSKRPYEGMTYTPEFSVRKEWCPRCSGRNWALDLSYATVGRYSKVEYPNNYLQHMLYYTLVEAGMHPFYPTLGTSIRAAIGRKSSDFTVSPEREVIEAVGKYSDVRTQFSKITKEDYTVVKVNSVDVTRPSMNAIQMTFYTNLGTKTFGVSL